MFMDYMDYTDDVAMNLFTADQVARMQATLSTTRTSLLASDAFVPATGVTADLWSQDTSGDTGAEPDTSPQDMWLSDDIWVRTSNDGLMNQDHQNPEYRATGPSNYVYVRVRNRGCSGVQSGTLRLYWAKASTGLSWPAPWDGTVTSPALMGGSIGSQAITVAGGNNEIVTFTWAPPNPADYASFGADKGHFCLLARVETGPAPGFGMTVAEGSNLEANVRNNNNIVWKNVEVVDEANDRKRESAVLVANYTDKRTDIRLLFSVAKEEPTVLDWADVVVELSEELLGYWNKSGRKSSGLEQIGEVDFRVLETSASLGAFAMPADTLANLSVTFAPRNKVSFGARVLAFDLKQLQGDQVVGGQRFVVKLRPDQRGINLDAPTNLFDGVGWAPAHADIRPCGC
jgi:hypothetical protein